MKKRSRYFLSATLAALLMTLVLFTGCGAETKDYGAEDYILEIPYKEDFKILQLTDLHMANKDNRQLQYDFMELTVRDADPDLIVLDGDIFTFADKTVAKELFAWVDSFGCYWTCTFGNHDEQCYFSVDWLTDYLNNFGGNCIFRDLQDDAVTGNANFAINLTENGETVSQVIVMDSNRYHYGSYWGYDYIKENQVDWYENLVTYTTEQNGGTPVPSLLFFHIPLPEYNDAWEAAENGDPDAILEYGEKNEVSTPPEYNSGMFDKIRELGSTKAVMVGHDHKNNFRILYKGIYLIYGVNANDRIYYREDMMGGHTVTVHRDGSLTFDHIYHTYDELEKEAAK